VVYLGYEIDVMHDKQKEETTFDLCESYYVYVTIILYNNF